jgi:hypothetical protein
MEHSAMISMIESLGLGYLTNEQRLQLGRELLDGVVETVETPPALLREIERREADIEEHPEDGIPWETVHSEALKRCKR